MNVDQDLVVAADEVLPSPMVSAFIPSNALQSTPRISASMIIGYQLNRSDAVRYLRLGVRPCA